MWAYDKIYCNASRDSLREALFSQSTPCLCKIRPESAFQGFLKAAMIKNSKTPIYSKPLT